MEINLIQEYDQIRKLKSNIKKLNVELTEKNNTLSYRVKKIIEVIHNIEKECLSKKRLLDSKGSPILYESYRNPNIISIQNKNSLIKIRYSYEYSRCGGDHVTYSTLKIPKEYLSLKDDKIKELHTIWTMNKIEASNVETLRKNQEQHDKWVNDARESEYKRYLELKEKYGTKNQ